ncbi:Trafficking protein particle complex subunit 6B [Cyanidiococcus yangmingshanensis]|uniref:Trafficking protein particle complex subunit 6B n=1 Tax=Cyanidiococcus yangmingshanensis TaxID=2690220 RepID=A0A7J7IIP2_9RHOD|nr:Trafficking protein particle complex subunit 6B [Cyanidiococcus yangmingshanensis]
MDSQVVPGVPTRGAVDSTVLDFLLMELVAESVSEAFPMRTTLTAKRGVDVDRTSVPLPQWHAPNRAWMKPESAEPNQSSGTAEMPPLQRVEEAGFYVGERLVRKESERASPEQTGMTELDALKVVCRDIWRTVFGKQVDSLKTNHRGVYVIFDASFRWLRYVHEMPDSIGTPSWYCIFPAGLIRGVLTELGYPCAVQGVCEPAPPSVVFTVRMLSASASESATMLSDPP